MKLIRLDTYQTRRGGFDVYYDPRRGAIVQTGRDDLGNRFEDESPVSEFIQDLAEDENDYLIALIESLVQNKPEIMVQWGISVEVWEQARQRGDFTNLPRQD